MIQISLKSNVMFIFYVFALLCSHSYYIDLFLFTISTMYNDGANSENVRSEHALYRASVVQRFKFLQPNFRTPSDVTLVCYLASSVKRRHCGNCS